MKDVESEQIVVNFPDPDNLMSCEITIKPGATLCSCVFGRFV